ncbi:hypothetical protein CLV92_11068 [Kineococcus xinjiangensis]|uniref:YdbS-like PH domain-containing protein n=1 Tax=Kineococcus xinjiangensis TaxID=512762 RepID=A0A2S6IH09_9ACTN|nr:hypothetical protein CLV92_11068 [Kineococcus xinjiangensis]
MSVEPFAPPGVTWSRLSPRLVTVRRAISGVVTGVLAVGLLVAGVLVSPWFHAGAGLVLLSGAWEWWLIGRQVPAWGYAERDDDLLVLHGLLFRTLVVVPYGRMQYVDVKAGPVERRFGIATLQLHTASASTDAVIPGLPPEEAARLRDRLAGRGEARLAGL